MSDDKLFKFKEVEVGGIEPSKLGEGGPLVPLTPGAMPELMRLAVEKGGIEALERLVALNERMMALAAKQAFSVAMANFKESCPPVPRRSENNQFKVTRNGVQVNRRYSALEDIEATIRRPAGLNGLSFRWGDAAVNGGMLTLACIVSHVGGHSETSNVTLPLESRAGCSEAQKYGAVMTYAQRYSLIQAFGLTTCDEDVDGAAGSVAYVTIQQVEELEALIDQCPAATRDKLLQHVGVATLEEIPAERFAQLKRDLETKIRKSK